jgi:HAD superfamily hydrolase (TIGR01549 family)
VSVAVVFDMDGTLISLPVDIEEARLRIAELFGPYGFSGPFRPILSVLRDAARWAAERGGDAADLERAGRDILDQFEVQAARAARVAQDAVFVVSTLKRRGIALGLLTDNGRRCVEPALRRAGLDPAAFAVIVTRDDVTCPKPDPEGLRLCQRGLGDTRIRWYIGDHTKDMQAGRAAALVDCRLAALSGKHMTHAELLAAGAEHVLCDLREVLALAGLAQVL